MSLKRRIRKAFPKKTSKSQEEQKTKKKLKEQDALSTILQENIDALQATYSNCPDVVFRPFLIGNMRKAVLIYIEGLSDIHEMDKSVLTPLMQFETAKLLDIYSILEQKLPVTKVKKVNMIQDAIKQISSGNPVVLIDQQSQGVSLGLAKWENALLKNRALNQWFVVPEMVLRKH